jgi:hypothetical protein
MQSMTVEEARESFDRLLEMAKCESLVLRDGEREIAVAIPMSGYAVYCRWLTFRRATSWSPMLPQTGSPKRYWQRF